MINPNDTITKEEVKKAIEYYSRKSPIEKYVNIIIEIAFTAPYFNSKPSEGLDPTFYHTLSFEGDKAKYERLKQLVRVTDEI